MKKILVSIIIPTFNAGSDFKETLDCILNQDYKNFEVIVIDSGSSDNTVDLIKSYGAIRLIEISQSEFGHGKTRNFGATLAKGEYLVYLTQDAVPKDTSWLSKLILPLKDKNIVGVYGRQLPRLSESVTDTHFYYNLYPDKNRMWNKNNYTQGDNIFSSVNSAIKKDIFLKNMFPQNIIVSEDYKWAIDILRQGYNLLYTVDAPVIHSHSYNDLKYLFKRSFDIGISYRDIYDEDTSTDLLRKGIKLHISELKSLLDSDNVQHIPMAIIKDIIRFVGITLGKKGHLFPKVIKKNIFSAQSWYWL